MTATTSAVTACPDRGDLARRRCLVKAKLARSKARRRGRAREDFVRETVYWDAGTARLLPRLTSITGRPSATPGPDGPRGGATGPLWDPATAELTLTLPTAPCAVVLRLA